MTMQLTIAVAGLLGLIVGLSIGRNGRKERDKRISELEQRISELENELIVKQNVAEALNSTIQRLRKKLKKKGYETDDCDN